MALYKYVLLLLLLSSFIISLNKCQVFAKYYNVFSRKSTLDIIMFPRKIVETKLFLCT